MLTYRMLKDRPWAFLPAPRLTVAELDPLLPAVAAVYDTLDPAPWPATRPPRPRAGGGGVNDVLAPLTDTLLFLLVDHKSYPLQTRRGVQFGLQQPQTRYWLQGLRPVWQRAGDAHRPAPQRAAPPGAQVPPCSRPTAPVVSDGPERRRPRPGDPRAQTLRGEHGTTSFGCAAHAVVRPCSPPYCA